MNVTCPQCSTTYRVDPAKVPAAAVIAQCARCLGTFEVRAADAAVSPAGSNASPVRPAGSVTALPGLPSWESAQPTAVDGAAEWDDGHYSGSRVEADVAAASAGTDGVAPSARADTDVDEVDPVDDGLLPDAEPAYSGASDVAFHTDEDASELPYLSAPEPSIAEREDEPAATTTAVANGQAAPGASEGEAGVIADTSDDDRGGRSATTTDIASGGAHEAAGLAGVAGGTGRDSQPPLPPAPFGTTDPHRRAARLARALVSDIVVYHPDRRARSLRQGTLRQEFREEIRKSWEEYTAQVGGDFARQTSYFKEALNEILAEGASVF